MPQMAPMWWLTLFVLFSITFLLVNSVNFWFNNNNILNLNYNIKEKKMLNWKW